MGWEEGYFDVLDYGNVHLGINGHREDIYS